MRKLWILFLLFAAVGGLAQTVRYDAPFPSVSSTSPPFLVANVGPNSPTISVCNSPANALPCTNFATTYNSTGVACPNGAQDTPQPQPSACQPTGDSQGNIGFWALAGTYDYTVCIQNNCFGPYTVTLGGSGGGGGIGGVTTLSGSGLQGGGLGGILNISLTTACAAGQGLVWNGSAWACVITGPGSVSSVLTGTGLTGGPITGTGTISLNNTAVTPGSYVGLNGTVDATGRLTSASNGLGGITTASGTGLIGGGSTGTLALGLLTTCSSTQVLAWNGSAWACASVGTGTITGVTTGVNSGLTGGGGSGTLNVTLLTTCLTSQVLAWNGTTWVCTSPSAGTVTGVAAGGFLQSTGSTLGMITSCTTNQVPQWNGASWVCSNAGAGTVNGPGTANAIPYWTSTTNQGSLTNVAAGSVLASKGISTAPAYLANALYDVRNLATGNFVDDNSTDNTTAVSALLVAIGSTPATIQMPVTAAGKYKVGNFQSPTNVVWDFSAGGGLSAITSSTSPGGGGYVSGTGTANASSNSCSVTVTASAGQTIFLGMSLYVSWANSPGQPTDGSNDYFVPAGQTIQGVPQFIVGWVASGVPAGTRTITIPIYSTGTTTPASSQNACIAYVISGLGPLVSVDAFTYGEENTHGVGNATALAAGPITTTTGSFLVAIGGSNYTTATCTAGAGYTQPTGVAGKVGTGQGFCSEYLASSAGGATSATQTLSANGGSTNAFALFSLKPGSARMNIQGGIVAPGLRQIFYNSAGPTQGTVDLTFNTGINRVYPEWWGAGASASPSVNTPAIQAASIAAIVGNQSPYAKTLDLSQGQYQLNAALIWNAFNGTSGSRWKVDCGANGGLIKRRRTLT